MQNLFGFGQPTPEGFGYTTPPDFGGNQLDIPPPQPQEEDLITRYMKMYKPEDTYTKKLEELLGQYPQEPKHSFWQKLGASMIGLGYGPKGADYALHSGHEGDIQDWRNKVQPYEYLAGIEKSGNINQRQFINQLAGRDIAEQEHERKTLEGERKLNIAQQRADAYEWKIKNPTHKIQSDRAGYLIGIDPSTNQSSYVLDSAGNRILSSDVPELEILQKKHDYKQAEIDNAAAHAMDRTVVAGAGVYTQPDETGTEQPITFNPRQAGSVPKKLPGKPMQKVGTPSAAGESETQKKIADYRRAKMALETHPEWKEFIKEGQYANTYNLVPPKAGWGGVDSKKQAAYEAARDFIYPSLSNPAKPITVAGPTLQQKFIKVKEVSTGKIGSWPADQPLASGYVKVEP